MSWRHVCRELIDIDLKRVLELACVGLQGSGDRWVVFRNLRVDFEEDRDSCDIIDDRVILFPFLRSCPDYGVASLLGAVGLVVRPDNLSDILVGEELPDAVRANNYKSVLERQLEPHDFWVCANSDHVRDSIADRATHSEAGELLIAEPDSHGSDGLPVMSFNRIDAASHLFDSRRLDLHLRLMVHAQRGDLQSLRVFREKHGSRIA